MIKTTALQSARYFAGSLIALGVDLAVVFISLHLGAPKLVARAIAMIAGVTTTYFFNRRFTFRADERATFGEWIRYIGAQSFGTALNFGVSSALLLVGDGSRWHVAGAVIVGAGIGFVCNFFAARRVLHKH